MDSDQLKPRQRKAIAALLSESTLKGAAGKIGISERTLTRYMGQEPFRQALAAAESAAIDAAARNMVDGAKYALAVLKQVMAQVGAMPDQGRMAADAWLKHTLKLYEIRELNERLTELEKNIGGKNGND